nr:hypothetical protein [Tanacetum cinerariifolium]
MAVIFSSSSYDDDFCVDVTNLALKPNSVAKALDDPDWAAAMQEEMQQFFNQQVWKLVPLPDRKIVIGTKWIFKNKRDAKGIVVRNKARLVAQGHRQKEGIDYDEMDVKSASSMGKLKKKCILHQAPKAWYARLSTFLLKHHYRRAWCDEFKVLMKGEFEMSDMDTNSTLLERGCNIGNIPALRQLALKDEHGFIIHLGSRLH